MGQVLEIGLGMEGLLERAQYQACSLSKLAQRPIGNGRTAEAQ